jgi:hypothetical protein
MPTDHPNAVDRSSVTPRLRRVAIVWRSRFRHLLACRIALAPISNFAKPGTASQRRRARSSALAWDNRRCLIGVLSLFDANSCRCRMRWPT